MNEESKLIELFKKIPRHCCMYTEVICLSLRPKSNGKIESEVATINKDDAATIIQEQEKYKPLIMEKFQYYKDNFDEEEHAEEIDYYLNFLEEPETLYIFTENIINLFKSFIK